MFISGDTMKRVFLYSMIARQSLKSSMRNAPAKRKFPQPRPENPLGAGQKTEPCISPIKHRHGTTDRLAAPCPEHAKAPATLPGIARRRERSRTRTALLTVPGTGIDRRPRSLLKEQPGKFPASRFISVATVRTGCEIRQFVPHDEPLSTALH